MHRLIAILLIPFFLVGNSLAHSHGSAAHQFPSSGRAHIHVGSATQHGHSLECHEHSHHGHDRGHSHGHAANQNHKSDSSKRAPVESTADHESDAIYIAASVFVGTSSARASIEVDSCDFVDTIEGYLPGNRLPARHDRPPLATTTELPLYLLHAALRL